MNLSKIVLAVFSKGQLIFASLFFISFVIGIIWAYWKDKEKNIQLFKGSYKIILFVILIFLTLFGIVKFKHILFP
jgi:D-alanyl-lipoteichoic acid acyltransferase DltB (MBOAT superfamily)